MPKPLKKPARKQSTTPKRPSSAPNRRAAQLLAEHLEQAETSSPPWKAQPEPVATPPHGDPFEVQFRARMAELGRKGGQISGAKRMDNLSERRRKEIAKRGAAARWAKKGHR